MKQFFIILVLFLATIFGGIVFLKNSQTSTSGNQNKTYVLDKTQGEILVMDMGKKQQLKSIDLTQKEDNFSIQFTPHSSIIIPDKKSIWVTASISDNEVKRVTEAMNRDSEGDRHIMTATDQVIVIDTLKDKILKRIPIGANLKVAHIALSPSENIGYITAESGNAIYKINAITYKVDGFIQLPPDSRPHHIAISQDKKEIHTLNELNKVVYAVSVANNNDIYTLQEGTSIADISSH